MVRTGTTTSHVAHVATIYPIFEFFMFHLRQPFDKRMSVGHGFL